jgi:hypothetical protein
VPGIAAAAAAFAAFAVIAYGRHQSSSSFCLSWRLARTHPAAKNMIDAGDYNGRTLGAAHYSGPFSA